MWGFIIGIIVGFIIGVCLTGLVLAAPDYEEEDKDDEDKRGGIL